MSKMDSRLTNAPIVEAVVDILCDMGPTLNLAALENSAREVLHADYPKLRLQFLEEHRIERHDEGQQCFSARKGLQALQFLHDDGKQLVQIRTQGFSFNRLAPYSSLDDYLPEIERTWRTFVQLVKPVEVQKIRLRYINRILLPMTNGQVDFADFLKVGPRLPEENNLRFVGFLNQHVAVDVETGSQVTIITTTRPGANGQLPLIFDIEVAIAGTAEPGDWPSIRSRIDLLRNLKNRVFRNTLTDKCMSLFSRSAS